MMKNQIAIYLRLSFEDVDKRTNAVKMTATASLLSVCFINRHLIRHRCFAIFLGLSPAMTDFPAPILTVLIFSG